MKCFNKFLRSLALCFLSFALFSNVSFAQKYNKYEGSYNFRKGMEALEERDYDKAEEAFEREVDEHYDNAYAYLYLAHIQLTNDEYGKALASIEKALKYLPKKDKNYRGACYYKKAGICGALGKYDEAVANYTLAIACNSYDDDSLWERAQIYYEQGKYDLADADYQSMLKIDPNQPSAILGLGRNQIARENYEPAVDLFDNLIAMYSNYSRAYAYRGEAYFNLKRYTEAASDVVKALSIDGDNKAFALMQDVADSAFIQMSAKLKAQAVTNPNESYWPYCLGIINEITEKYSDALTHYAKALKLDEDAITYRRISSCHLNLCDWASAIEAMDKAIGLDPKNDDLLASKAGIYYEAGQVDTAVTIMDEYVERVPDDSWGYYQRAWFKDRIKDYDGALEDFTVAITLNPDDVHSLVSRGNVYLVKGETELAMKDYEEVVQRDTIPEDGSVAMYAMMRLGRNDEAVEWMNKMLESSEDESIRYEAACLYSLMGDTEKSLCYLEESLKKGNKSYNHIMIDSDLDNIHSLEAFAELMEKYFPQEVKAETSQGSVVEYTERVVEVPFTRTGGVTQVKCNVNGLPLHFIFDTGAADVTISRVEATFMFKNEYLTADDVVGKARYIDANGDISVGTVLNIKKITFGGLELENVRASVVDSNNAPLLLGQSVLNRLGKIEIDYDRSVLKITTNERVL